MLDVKRLISEVASRNGIRLDEDDPAFCLVTINQIVLEETAEKIVEDVRTATREFEQAAERLHRRSGVIIAEQIKDSIGHIAAVVGSRAGRRSTSRFHRTASAGSRWGCFPVS